MTTETKPESGWSTFLSPLRLILLAVNGVAFGACIVLLAMGVGSALLTVGVFLSFGAGAVGAWNAIKEGKSSNSN